MRDGLEEGGKRGSDRSRKPVYISVARIYYRVGELARTC